jgi:hypothetical protein
MVNANIDIFEMTYEKSVSYFKRIENLENIRSMNGSKTASIPVDNKKSVSVAIIADKSSKHHKGSNKWCHFSEKNNHNMTYHRAISKSKLHKKACFEAKAGPRKKSLAICSQKEDEA